jgi:hypothetical protein
MGEFYCHFDFIDNLELFCLDAPYPSLPIGTYRWWLWVAKELSVFAIGERGCRGTVLDVLNQCFTFIPEYITPSLKRFEAEATDWAWHCSPAEYKARIKDSQHFCTAPRDYCSIDDGVVAIPDKNAELSPWCKKYLLSHNYL